MIAHLVLRWYYGHHRRLWAKWRDRQHRYERKRGTKVYYGWWTRRVTTKLEYHRFWFSHYCTIMSAHGHHITCVHFGPEENTLQSGSCPLAVERGEQ